MIFDECSVGQKSSKNPTFRVRDRKKQKHRATLCRVGTSGGVRKRLLESEGSLQKSDQGFGTLSPHGGGGSECA